MSGRGAVLPVLASQTVPILAIAPMIIVVLASVGLTGLLPKAIISMYLSFFPVVVGMVQGLRSPDPMLIDQMRTWNASRRQVFFKLRWPAALPWLFASASLEEIQYRLYVLEKIRSGLAEIDAGRDVSQEEEALVRLAEWRDG